MARGLPSLRRGGRRRDDVLHGRAAVGDDVTGVVLSEPDARGRLRRIAAEAVLLQDQAEEVLAGIAAREALGAMAPRGGPLATRFFALRLQVPRPLDPLMERRCETLRVILDHHGTVLATALEMLASEWRSPAVADQLERLTGLGAPAERLDALYAELAREA